MAEEVRMEFITSKVYKKSFCVVMLGLTNVNILYYSFSTLYRMCNLRYNHIRGYVTSFHNSTLC